MTKITRNLLGLYLFLLLILAFLGVSSQQFLQTHREKLSYKQELVVLRTQKRVEASHLSNPEAIITWAKQQGMVTTASPTNALIVEIALAPKIASFEPRELDLKTQWQ